MIRLTGSDVLGFSRFPLAALLVAVPAAWTGSGLAIAGTIVVAGLTDLFDGLLARRSGAVDRSGGILDYTADKFFFAICFVVLVARGDVGVTIASIAVGRDVAVSGMRLVMFTGGADLPARRLGKIRTTVMFPALGLAALDVRAAEPLLLIVAALSVASLLDYGTVFLRHLQRAGRPDAIGARVDS